MTDSLEASLVEEVGSVPWYHTLELPGGILTPGEYDLRGVTGQALLPGSLAGRRCLDVGTHDGFWAFEMERRTAAEVAAIDIDDPACLDWPEPPPRLLDDMRERIEKSKRAFWIAHRALESSVERWDLSVYDLSPAMVGEFEFAFIGTLLHHLRDPIGALMAIRRVVTEELLVSAVFSISETILHPKRPRAEILAIDAPFWTVPNLAGIKRQIASAGWRVKRVGHPYLQQYGAGWQRAPLSVRGGAWSTLPRQVLLRFGALHLPIVAEPVRISA